MARAEDQVSFFTSLRRLGRDVDHGVKDIEVKLDTVSLQSNNRHLALKGLRDRKKDVESLKANTSDLLRELRQRGSQFGETLTTCSEVIDSQLSQLSTLQSFLTQYGFVQPQEADAECDITEKPCDETNDEEVDPPPATPPEGSVAGQEERKSNLSPCLEDFGLSSYTLNMLKRPAQQPAFKAPTLPRSVVERGQPRNNSETQDCVPTPFQHQGLTVTPSLFGGSKNFCGEADNEPFSTPDHCSRRGPRGGGVVQQRGGDGLPSHPQARLAQTLDFDSPVIPVLHTPGAKQIPHLSSLAATPLQAPSVSGRPLCAEGPEGMDSPVPPVLRTPGIQQISTRSTATKADRADRGGDHCLDTSTGLDLPHMPDLTYSLQDLADMTISTKYADTSYASTQSPPPAGTSSSYLDASHPAPRSHHPARHGAEASTAAQHTAPEWPGSSWKTRLQADSLEAPPTPELTLSYASLSQFKPSHPPAPAPREERDLQNPELTLSYASLSQFQPSHPPAPAPREERDLQSASVPSDRTTQRHGTAPGPHLSSRDLDLDPVSPELTLSYTNMASAKSLPADGRHGPRADVRQDSLLEPQLSTLTKDRCEGKLGDVPVTPELTMSYTGHISKARTNLSSRLAAAADVQGQGYSGVQGHSSSGMQGHSSSGMQGQSYSGLQGHTYSGMQGQSYSGMYGQSYAGVQGHSYSGELGQRPGVVPCDRSLQNHVGDHLKERQGLASERYQNKHAGDDFGFRGHVSHAGSDHYAKESSADFSFSQSSTAKPRNISSDVPRSKENIGYPGVMVKEADLDSDTKVVTGQPRVHQPLLDSKLDLPATPNFMGSYHFMGSKR